MKRTVGRPKKIDDEKRIYRMSFRCTKEEKERLEELSQKLGVSQADTLRTLVLEANNIVVGKG